MGEALVFSLFESLRSELERFVRRQFRFSIDDAEDAVSKGLLKAVSAGVREDAHPHQAKALLYRAVFHAALDLMRDRRRHATAGEVPYDAGYDQAEYGLADLDLQLSVLPSAARSTIAAIARAQDEGSPIGDVAPRATIHRHRRLAAQALGF